MSSSEVRERRYAEAVRGVLDCFDTVMNARAESDSISSAVMAVADAEQAELRAEVERLRMVDDGRLAADLTWMDRAEAAEAKVARVEALHDKWASARNISDGRPNPVLIGISAMLRAALDGE